MHFVEHLSIVYITALPLRPCKCSQQQQQQLHCFSNSCLDLHNRPEAKRMPRRAFCARHLSGRGGAAYRA